MANSSLFNMNKGCLNALWHFPFLGFLFALFYAIYGVLACCTIILIPLGLGYFQVTKYLLSPYSNSMVKKEDLRLLNPKLDDDWLLDGFLGVISRILFFPFGLISAGLGLLSAISWFCSIIGILPGIVYWKLLPTLFNPVGKVCVPKEVANEIEKMKKGDVLSKYKAEKGIPDNSEQTTSPQVNAAITPMQVVAPVSQQNTVVRSYTTEKLQDIVDNAAMYQSKLVWECSHELEIRNEAATFVEQVKAFDDAKIREILSNKDTYSEALVYAVEQELAERQRAYREKEAQEMEAERQRRAKEEEDERKRRIAWWKKWGWLVGTISAVVVAIIVALYFTSSGYYYSSGIKSLESGDTEMAIKFLSKIDDRTDSKYMGAKGVLFEIYSSLGDEKNASRMVNEIYNAVKMCGEDVLSSVWDSGISEVAYRCCAESILLGKYIQSETIDYETALKLYKNLSEPAMCGACLYHMGRYKEAYEIFKELHKNRVSLMYLGLMYDRRQVVSSDCYKMYKEFDKVTFERLGVGNIEKGKEWCRLEGFPGVWNLDILMSYLTGKGDLKLIYGDIDFESKFYGDDFQCAYNCYETAAKLFPDDKICTKRYQIMKKVIDLPIDKKEYARDWYSNNNLWLYCGEYVDTNANAWVKEVTPHGYGVYSEFAPGGTNIKTVVGKFVKLGRKHFNWVHNSIHIQYYKDDKFYSVGYWEKNKFYPLAVYYQKE